MLLTITDIIFRNATNGYHVLQCEDADGHSVTATGSFATIRKAMTIEAEGEWATSKYGPQFRITSWQEVLPTTLEGLVIYLSSSYIKGIGPTYARLIVNHFGLDTIDILDNDITRLREVKGIGPKRIAAIAESWEEHRIYRQTLMWLTEHGITTAYATKIYKTYEASTIDIITADPYRLAADIDGIGFHYADNVARTLGYTPDDPRRQRAAILHALRTAQNDGHTFLTRPQLEASLSELLQIPPLPDGTSPIDITAQLAILEAKREIVISSVIVDEGASSSCEAIYLSSLYHAERSIATDIAARSKTDITTARRLTDCSSTYDVLSPEQRTAVSYAIRHQAIVLTGGPGTGKTTTTKSIIHALEEVNHLTVLCAAPTGRAAKRMRESTGHEASTIHRLLEYKPGQGFTRNDANPLEADAVIIDECSMIDVTLMAHLLEAINLTTKLILVGDIDQLPSVGPGNVLRDIITSRAIPVVHLTEVFRQAQESRIIMGAHAVNAGQYPNISGGRDADLFFIPCEDPTIAAREIVNLVINRLPSYYQDLTPDDIQVLTPMRKTDVGTNHLNRLLQQSINDYHPDEVTGGSCSFREDDKVMQLKNNYSKGVFNGDIGKVIWIENEKVTVLFDDNEVTYESHELDQLSLAYACTIHKSQGSEYPAVIIPIMTCHHIMLQRNLIYTAITRARKLCILIGQREALSQAIRNNSVRHRNSALAESINNKIQ